MIYLGIPLEQWKNNMVCHLRDERKRNDLLQRKLDEANAQIARMQAEMLDMAMPLPKRLTPLEQLRSKSPAVRRLLASRGITGV